jgi:hypothetical protein
MDITIVEFKDAKRFNSELIALILLTSFVRFETLGILNPSLYIMVLALGILSLKKILLVNIKNILLLVLIFTTTLIFWLFDFYDLGDFYRTTFNILPSLALAAFFPATRVRILDSSLNRTLIIILIFYIAEAMIRLKNPEVRMGDEFFYAYKYNSYMYGDSNFTALALLALFWLIDTIYLKSFRKLAYLLIVFLLILITFSRAAYVAIIFYFIFKKINKKYIIFTLTLAILTLFFLLGVNGLHDASLLTKFEIVNGVLAYSSNTAIFTLLVGTGLEKFVALENTNWAGHSIAYFILVSFGLINSFFFFLILSSRFRKEYWTLYISQLVASLSLFTYYFPYLMASRLISEVKINKNAA